MHPLFNGPALTNRSRNFYNIIINFDFAERRLVVPNIKGQLNSEHKLKNSLSSPLSSQLSSIIFVISLHPQVEHSVDEQAK